MVTRLVCKILQSFKIKKKLGKNYWHKKILILKQQNKV